MGTASFSSSALLCFQAPPQLGLESIPTVLCDVSLHEASTLLELHLVQPSRTRHEVVLRPGSFYLELVCLLPCLLL